MGDAHFTLAPKSTLRNAATPPRGVSATQIMAVRVLLIIGSLLTSQAVEGAKLPTEEEVKGVQNLCGAGNIQALTVKGDVDAAIASWKKASAGADVEVAKKNLAAALGQVKDDADLAPVYKLYIDCVSNTLKQYLAPATEQPAGPAEDKGQCMAQSAAACSRYSASRLHECAQADLPCKRRGVCWEDKSRALVLINSQCGPSSNQQSCELFRAQTSDIRSKDCDVQ